MTVAQIIKEVAKRYGLTEDQLVTSHVPECVKPRHICWYVLSEYHHKSYSEIGRQFDCDHSTVISAVKRVKKEPWFKEIQEIRDIAFQVPPPPPPNYCPSCGQHLEAGKWAKEAIRKAVDNGVAAMKAAAEEP